MKIIVFTALLLFVIAPLFAREVEILVEDADLGLPLEGAVIRSWDGRQYTCGRDGKALVNVPDDRQVVLQAAYPGYENGRLVITMGSAAYKISLRLSGVMESRELVIEAERPGTGETKTGRSVAVSGREITQTAEIGVIEDVMNSIKLLPGVGYSGFFNAQPSIRGGFPGDMNASLDGYYVMNPYHWGGGFSIFDPRMVESAQLSHGVFSARYGHTISGLLDISSKKPSPADTEYELGINSSAANFALSFPFAATGSRGGILIMGRITYYDPVIWLMQALGDAFVDIGLYTQEQADSLNAIRQAPYIRSMTITGNYRFSDDLEIRSTGFWGMDGVGFSYDYESKESGGISSVSRTVLDWTNYQGFITATLNWNPRNDMLAKIIIGVGYEDSEVDAKAKNSIRKNKFSDDFLDKYSTPGLEPFLEQGPSPYNTDSFVRQSDLMVNAQARADYDWEPGKGFLVAAGIQEMFTMYKMKGSQQGAYERRFYSLRQADQDRILRMIPDWLWENVSEQFKNDLRIAFPSPPYSSDAENYLLTTSGYSLVEYSTPNKRFNAELGLRIDHYYLFNDDFSLSTRPAFNPRFNAELNVFKNKWIIESFDISAGTGLFSTVDNSIFMAEEKHNLIELKPNRSWTSVLGTRITFPEGIILNIEGYYKYIFDRLYVPIRFGLEEFEIRPQSDGEGHVWGIDLMLQKLQSRYWDGWLTYSFSWARYRDPSSNNANMGISGGTRGNDWYYPNFHRFHNLNLVVNYRPSQKFNFYTRFGLASGTQLSRRLTYRPETYPVLMYDDDPENFQLVQKYDWPSRRDEENRTGPSLSLDIKFSYFGMNRTGRLRYELYAAVENLLSLVYMPQGNPGYNTYTGEISADSSSASYGMPIPIPSFGFKLSY
jgi:hypothetical protein